MELKSLLKSNLKELLPESLFNSMHLPNYISIENLGKDTIQLVSRHWKILESTNRPNYLKDNGVVGVKPILKSGEIYSYKSGCHINSTVGSMSGKYTMINFTNAQKFSVDVPNFKLSVPYILN